MSTDSAYRIKRSMADAIRRKMAAENLSINGFAKRTKTGRNAVKRILDKKNTSITLKTIAKAMDALGLQIQLTIKPGTPDELNQIAKRMVAAPTKAETQKLKQEYLRAFYGKSVHAEDTAG